jgi:hypothetical protein
MRNYINQSLVKEQGLDPQDVQAINTLHFIMNVLLAKAEECAEDGVYNREVSKGYEAAVELIELHMQKCWKFSMDTTYHTHYKRLPEVDKCESES